MWCSRRVCQNLSKASWHYTLTLDAKENVMRDTNYDREKRKPAICVFSMLPRHETRSNCFTCFNIQLRFNRVLAEQLCYAGTSEPAAWLV